MRLPLRVFLFVALSVATLAPIAYLGPTQVARWREVQRIEADKELRSAAESLARAIGEAIDANVRGLTSVAGHIGTRGSLEPVRLQAVLHNHCANFPSWLGINVCGPDARPFVIEPPTQVEVSFSDRAYHQEMVRTGRTAISGVEIGRITKVPTIHVAAPIWATAADGSRVRLGALVGALGLGYLQEQTTRAVEVFGDMRAQVLDKHRRVIVDSNPRGLPPLADLSGIELYANVRTRHADLRSGYGDAGEPVRAALARVSEQQLGWTVVVMRPVWKIEEQARHARASAWIAVLGALALGMTLAFVLSSWLARPISRLARFTLQVVGGDRVSPPATARWDAREVTDLVGTVGSMVEKLRSQADALRAHEKEQVELARFRRELEIAEHIQTAILPKAYAAEGFEIAAQMQPAEVVGGDYYDILPTETGLWIGTGDVSGHGLSAGLVMLMLQSALGALAQHAPGARPAEIWGAVNRLLVGNIRNRLEGDDHVTLVLMRLSRDGNYVFAGGHEPLIVLRQGQPTCEVLATPGPWMGIRVDPVASLPETTGRLGPGDLLVLHSDGIVEAGATQHKPFGLERLRAAVERLRAEPATAICAEILREARAFAPGPQEDDMTIVVVRRRPE
jgi:serine phosphatase RsbU (regulator of sigma subunit)